MFKLLNWLCEKCGYKLLSNDEYIQQDKAQATVSDILMLYDEQSIENRGLRDSIYQLQLRHEDDNQVITCLISLMGKEQITLENELLDEVFKLSLVTIYSRDEKGRLVCTTQIPPQESNNADTQPQ